MTEIQSAKSNVIITMDKSFKENSTYSEKDKQTFINELTNYHIRIASITNDLNIFRSFLNFIIKNPLQAPSKLGIYITKVMRFDASKENKLFYYPCVTYQRKLGDCDDAALLCQYALELAGYTKPIKSHHLPLPVKLSDGSTSTLADKSFQFPLLVSISKDPLSKPIEECEGHAICVYSALDSGLLNILETRKGLTLSKSKSLIELADKFEPGWQRIVIHPAKNGIVDNNKPYILIKKNDIKTSSPIPKQ